MNKKQKAKRLKRLNASKKLYRETGFSSIRNIANANLKELQERDNRYE